MIYKKLLYILFVFGQVLNNGYGQATAPVKSDYIANVQHFTPEDGLSHRQVNAIVKDRRGIIWVGTQNGLNRFDNKNFKIFDKKDGLANSSIKQIYVDGDVLWCLHSKEIDRRYNTLRLFHTIEEQCISLEKHLNDKIPFKLEDIKNVFIHQDVLFFELLEHKKALKYSYSEKQGFKLLSFLQKNEFIIGKAKSDFYWTIINPIKNPIIRKLDTQGNEIQRLALDFVENLSNLAILYEEDNGITWFKYIKQDTKIFTLDQDNQLEWIPTSVDNEISCFHPTLNAFWRTDHYTSSLVTLENEVLVDVPLRIHNIQNNQFLVDGFMIWHPNSIGLTQIEIKKNNFKQIFANEKYHGFRSITQIDDDIFFNSYDGVYHSKSDLKPPYTKVSPSGLSSIKDKAGNLWISSFNILMRYNPKTQETKTYKDILAYEAWSLFEDQKNRIWYSHFGLYYLDPKTGQNYPVQYNEFQELSKATVYHFFEKEDGNILLCTTQGLYEMNLTKGIVARYWSGGKGKYHIPADNFRHLYFDETDQSYWLVANKVGLIHWQPNSKRSEVYPLTHLAANIIHAVYPDDFGFLWLSTENGIIQFHKKNKNFKAYTLQDGTSTDEFNRISHFQDEKGKIYFGSIKGINVFHPKEFQEELNIKQKASIQVIELNQYLAQTNSIQNLTTDFYENGYIQLHPGDRFFNLKLALTDYAYHGKTAYYYKIKNKDKDWTLTTGNELAISGLPFGQQILEIKALFPNGQFLQNILEIPVFVGKPFYLKWWFFCLLFGGIVMATLLFTHWRTQQLEAQKVLLKQEVQKRTAQIEQQAQELRELDKTKSKFFANVSHELRTPIMLIQGPIQSVLKSQELQAHNFNLLKTAAQNTKNLMRLVNEILELTKLDSQKLELHETNVVFYIFLRRIISSFQSMADAKSIELTFNCQVPQTLEVKLDQQKFEKVLNNLLSNAFKFTPKGGQISLTLSEMHSNLLLKVQDNGRGIPNQDIPYVFNRFYQSSSHQKAEGGLGIGLALSMEYIKLMEGKMWVESRHNTENSGSTFFVKFPKKEIIAMLSTEDKLELETLKSSNLSIETPRFIETKKCTPDSTLSTILLVEDNDDLRNYIAFLLDPFYQVLTAENGQEALNWLKAGDQADLIVSDIMMPIMDGYEFLEQLKKQDAYRHIPVIMLTARTESPDRLKALRIGVDDYLVKPFEEEELLARIENLLVNLKNRSNFWVEKLSAVETFTPTIALSEVAINKVKMSQADSEWLEQLEAYILESIGHFDLTSEQIAQELYISRTQLFRKIKALTGLTLQQYIKEIRLEKARGYLSNQQYRTVKEVAHAVGLKDTRNFSQNFKKQFGKLPSEYL